MKKDLLLVLCFYEGQGFCPKEEHSIALSARIDGNILSTDPVPQSSKPKFSTEVSWTVDHQTLRRYKLSRVPVRVECYSIDKNNESHTLGYIILTLSSVVQGIETDPKWHKLLGGNLAHSKVPPQLLLSLNLQPVNLNDKVKADSPRMLHNGNMHSGQYTVGATGSSVANHLAAQRNGTPHLYQDVSLNSHMAVPHQEAYQMNDFVSVGKLGALLSDRSSQLHISSSQKDVLCSPVNVENRGKVELGSARYDDNEYSQAGHSDLEGDDSNVFCKIGNVYSTHDVDMSSHEDEFHEKLDARVANIVQDVRVTNRNDAVSSESVNRSDFINCNGRVECKSKLIAASPVERVKSLLDGSLLEGLSNGEESLHQSHTHGTPKEEHDDIDIYAGLDDEALDSGFQSRFGGKPQESWLAAQPSKHNIGDIEQGIRGGVRGPQADSQNRCESKRYSDTVSDAVADKQNYIPLKNLSGGLQNKPHSSSSQRGSNNLDLVPRIDHEGGFIQIGPFGNPAEEAFEFAVTIIFAKNLDQLLPQDFHWNSSSATCFSYSLMGCMISSDPVKNLYNPEFQAERVSGNIHSTAANLSTYFKMNSEFPIHFLIGDLCLATASINLAKFQDFDSRLLMQAAPVTLEGSYPLVSVIPESSTVAPGKEPVIGIMMQLSGQPQRNTHHHITSALSVSESSESEADINDYALHHYRRGRAGRTRYHNSKFDALSSSSLSSDDDILPSSKRRRSTNARKLHRRDKPLITELYSARDLSDEAKKLKKHLYKAALEVESWKEDQQAIFLKQWSAREAELQRHLSDEWRLRIKTIEANLYNRLSQTDVLNKKLTSAVVELDSREKKLSVKEAKVQSLLEDLEMQKQQQEEVENQTFEGRLKQKEKKESNDLLEELKKEKEKREELEAEVEELRAAFAQAEILPRSQNQERKKEMLNLKKEKESLLEELAVALKKKQYYKVQWVRSVSELHHIKKARLYEVGALRSEVEMSSPEPFEFHPHHHKHHRSRGHNTEVGARKSKQIPGGRKSDKGAELLYSMKEMDSQRLKERTNVEPSCSWMDPPTVREKRNRMEPRMREYARSIQESERIVEVGKGRRTSVGNVAEYDELMRGKSNEEQLEKLFKENTVWKVGEK